VKSTSSSSLATHLAEQTHGDRCSPKSGASPVGVVGSHVQWLGGHRPYLPAPPTQFFVNTKKARIQHFSRQHLRFHQVAFSVLGGFSEESGYRKPLDSSG
jgi:hypothetical protein